MCNKDWVYRVFDVTRVPQSHNAINQTERPLPHVLPMPRLVEVRTKAKAFCISDQPLIRRGLNLDSTIGIPGLNRISTHIEIQCATRKVRTVHCQSSATCIG